MKTNLVIFAFILFSSSAFSQTKVPDLTLSEHLIHNLTTDTLYVTVAKINQKTTKEKTAKELMILPGGRTMVSSIKWDAEFRDPSTYYTIKFKNGERYNDPNQMDLWEFKKVDEERGIYLFLAKKAG
jgi:hypothetical protein